jgi:putative nucleotidyltransferase with HDIG domain
MQNWIRTKWKQYYNKAYRIMILAATIAIIALFLPKSGQFKYEYEKGRPWRHPILIAPFDFPIYKSAAELKNERDSLLRNFRPYFVDNNSVVINSEYQAAEHFKNIRQVLRQEYPSFFRSTDEYQADIEIIEEVITSELEKIYMTGIIEINESVPDSKNNFELMLIRGNVAEPYELNEFYTAKQAYEMLIANTMRHFKHYGEQKLQKLYTLLTEMDLNKIIIPDIVYSSERTEQEKQETLKNLSLTTGKVLIDQRIIGTGDIVDEASDKIINSLKIEYENRLGASSGASAILVGQLLIITVLMSSIFLFLFFFKKEVYRSLRSITFIMIIMLLMIITGSLTARVMPNSIYILPLAILPIILRTFFDSRLAIYVHVMTVLIIALHAGNSFQFAILHIPAGMVAIFTLVRMVRRSQIVRTMIFIVLTYLLIHTGLLLWQEGSFSAIKIEPFGQFLINGLLILLTYPLIYILEKTFGFVSDVTLLELSDTNHPLLRQLAEKAPGTFQHSIQVGNLAQEVAYRIGGNPLLVRAGAMYHDIGKMASPMYFTENQINNINPHNNLSFEDSAQIIINHVTEGVRMAKKNELPQQIIDFIATHHGTTKARYFYNSFVNTNPDIKPDESIFTYPGPIPFTKETAILMMSDAIEATSRSLKNYSDKDIDDLVEKIVGIQISEGQFNDSPITFKEIQASKNVFKQKLKSIYHARIEYPSLEKASKDNKPS